MGCISQACVIACVGILAITTVHMYRKGRQPRVREPGHSLSLEELAAGAHAGLCFGLSASSCRTGFMLGKLAGVRPTATTSRVEALPVVGTKLTQGWGRSQGSWGRVVAALGLLLSVVLTSTGLLVQTEALKDGRSVVVCTCTEAALMITAMVYGVYALGERLPATRSMQLLRYGSWLVIVVGISTLSAVSRAQQAGGGGGAAKGGKGVGARNNPLASPPSVRKTGV